MSAGEQETLATVLADAFAVDRLRALGWASVNMAALPALVLWIDAGIALPAPMVWLAHVTWPACAGLAVACSAFEGHFLGRLERALPGSRRLARLSFAAPRRATGSAIGSTLAFLLGGLLWVETVAPRLVAVPGPSPLVRTAWATLVAATIAVRWRERPT